MRNVLLVARRELRAGIIKKSFLISTAIMVAILVIAVFVLDYFANRDTSEEATQIAISAETEPLVATLTQTAAAQGTAIETTTLGDADGEAAVLDGDAAAFVTGTPPAIAVTFKHNPDVDVIQLLTDALQSQALADEVTKLGGDPAEFTQSIAAAAPDVKVLEGEIENWGPNYLVTIVVLGLLLFGLISSGSIISQGVVEEKASRVVEILLATIRPSELFAGKVLGAGLIGLIQLAIYGAAAYGAVRITGVLDGFDIPVGPQMLAMFGWFLLGFATLGTLWGALASLVSRQEDVGAVSTPMVFAVMIPFYVAIYLVPNAPESAWTTNLSIAPVFAPFVMPIRQVFSAAVPGWQLALAIVLNVVIVPLIVWLAGTIYHRAILHTGSRMTLSEVFTKAAD